MRKGVEEAVQALLYVTDRVRVGGAAGGAEGTPGGPVRDSRVIQLAQAKE